ncbi:hypothetical protein IW261DRAFT_1422642 [Armillaria novae-zelandiae]|uniref:DUF6535 domain-containing protein n=1 Tax=Armillaria novae-zelandiae TaxID=153914 RepID=A0AA39P0J3_9AGAR|nr:hypothetical protein IW261DRAFT_1422642 [Armillaria novae-zelandiae]
MFRTPIALEIAITTIVGQGRRRSGTRLTVLSCHYNSELERNLTTLARIRIPMGAYFVTLTLEGTQESARSCSCGDGGKTNSADFNFQADGRCSGGEHREELAEQGVESNEEEEENQASAAASSVSANAADAKKIFGTTRRLDSTAKKGTDAYNYQEKYPMDTIYEVTTPNAGVWRTYEDESCIYGANMVEESRDNVDVLLVFVNAYSRLFDIVADYVSKVSLFYTVMSTFVAQTSQSLQADYVAMSASLLYESVLIQHAIANGSSINSYHCLTAITPSTRSLCGLQSIADFMISHWDQIWDFSSHKSDAAYRVLTDLLAKHIPPFLPVFHESQCLQFRKPYLS